MWKRYVDDCFAIIPTSAVKQMLPYINSFNRNLQFTSEMEENGTLCYLDVKIIRQETGTFKFTVFRKASNTGRLLDYESYSSDIHKRNVVKSLVQRALIICSDWRTLQIIEFFTEWRTRLHHRNIEEKWFPKKVNQESNWKT